MLIGINHATTQSNWLPSLTLFSQFFLTVVPCWDDHTYSLDSLSFFLNFIISSMLQYIFFSKIMKFSTCSFEIIKTQVIWKIVHSRYSLVYTIWFDNTFSLIIKKHIYLHYYEPFLSNRGHGNIFSFLYILDFFFFLRKMCLWHSLKQKSNTNYRIPVFHAFLSLE